MQNRPYPHTPSIRRGPDCDVSPFSAIVKPTIVAGCDDRTLQWDLPGALSTMRLVMKAFILAVGIFAGVGLFGTGAHAQNYPWCAIYSGGMGGTRNCGFSTYEQCRAAVSGNGGYCSLNNLYVPRRYSRLTG